MTNAGGFVGRESELQQLDAAIEDALEARGRLVLVGGEPGIGKTRLTDEFASRARAREARVLWGRCWEAGGAPAFWPWVEGLRAYLAERDPADLRAELGSGAAEVARIFPEIREAIPDLPGPSEIEPETERFRLFESTCSFLRSAAASRLLVLILDDMHAADEPSLLLLRFLSRRLGGTRLVVVATYRDTELSRDHPLTAALVELGRDPATVRLALRGLTERDVARFVRGFTAEPPPPQLVRAIHAETEGNPLFVGEVVRLLAAEGRLDASLERASWAAAIPEGVREVIDMRLSRLSERCARLLVTASVVGREFGIEVLERSDGMGRAEILSAVDEAAAARLVSEAPSTPGRLRFSHALVRDALYERLGPGERARMHRQVGTALEDLYGAEPGPFLAELAHHFFAAAPVGGADRAVAYCARAADEAEGVLAYEEAVRLYGMALRALELAPESDDVTRCELLLGLGEAQARAGEAEGAKQNFLRAAEIARSLGRAEQLARAAVGYGGRFVWARAAKDQRLVLLLEEALEVLGDVDHRLRARLLARLAGARRDDPDPALRNELSREAVALARGLEDSATLGYVLDGRWAAIWGPDTTDERLELADELIRVAEASGDGERSFQGRHYRMACLLEMGDLSAARRELEAQAMAAARLRQPAQRWYLAAARALLALFEGRLEEGEALSREALRIGERAISSWDARFTHRVQLFLIRRDQGRLGEVEDAIRRSVEEYESSYPFIRAVLSLLMTELGRLEEARLELERMVKDGAVDLPRDNEWLFGVAVLAEVVAALGDADRAGVLYEQLAPYADRNVLAPIEAMTGSAARYLALLAATVGHSSDAERHFADALATNRRMGAEPAVARTLLDQAAFLLSSEQSGARDRAAESLTEALAIARRCGAAALASRAADLLRSLGMEVSDEERSRVHRAFMFTDMVRSTVLLEALGDDGWDDLRNWHDRTLRELFSAHGGEEVDHAGDGFFVAFPDPRQALDCAIAIQRRLAEQRASHGFAPRVRIGVHAGEATGTSGGYGGKIVHEAARIAGVAHEEEILASRTAAAAAGVPFSEEREVRLKGIVEPARVVAVDWRQQ